MFIPRSQSLPSNCERKRIRILNPAQVGSSSGGNSGDFEDPVTSPNDPLFFFHHANVDRSMRWWMLKNAAKRGTFYGFPAADAEGIRENAGKSYYGQNLLDVMSSTWGFTAADLGFSGASSGFQTNADLLCHNGPSTSSYTYDTEVACSGGSAACSAVWGDSTTTEVGTTEAVTTEAAGHVSNTGHRRHTAATVLMSGLFAALATNS